MTTAFSDLLVNDNGKNYPLINGIPILFAHKEENNNLYEQFYQSQAWYQGLADAYPNLKVRNEYLNKIEIIREIQKYNVLKE